MNKRRFVLITVIVLVLSMASSLVLFGRSTHNTKPSVKQNVSQFIPITNVGQYSSELGSSVNELQSTLYRKAMPSKTVSVDNLKGTIRSGSFTTQYNMYNGSTVPIQVPQYAFLVDIPVVKKTYQVTLSGGDDYPYKILYVLCPQANQLIYPAFGCTNEE